MENLDLIVMTSIVVLCFLFFFVSTFKAFENAADTKIPMSTNRGIISRFLAYLQSLVTE
jgi:hypothetical protein